MARPFPPNCPLLFLISDSARWPNTTAGIEERMESGTIPSTRLAIAFPLVWGAGEIPGVAAGVETVACASLRPQTEQKLAVSGREVPHCGQIIAPSNREGYSFPAGKTR